MWDRSLRPRPVSHGPCRPGRPGPVWTAVPSPTPVGAEVRREGCPFTPSTSGSGRKPCQGPPRLGLCLSLAGGTGSSVGRAYVQPARSVSPVEGRSRTCGAGRSRESPCPLGDRAARALVPRQDCAWLTGRLCQMGLGLGPCAAQCQLAGVSCSQETATQRRDRLAQSHTGSQKTDGAHVWPHWTQVTCPRDSMESADTGAGIQGAEAGQSLPCL